MKEHLNFYMNEWVSEWNQDFAELVIVSDLDDVKEHKVLIIQELTVILDMHVIEAGRGERDPEDLINLLDTIKWLVEL